MDWIQQWQSKLNKQNGVAPLVRTGGSRHTGLAALPYRNIHKPEYFTFTYNKEYVKVLLDRIYFFESSNRIIHIHMADDAKDDNTDETLNRFYGKMSDVERQLSESNGRFIRIHQSYLVNFDYIRQMNFSGVTMSDGTQLQISEDRQKEVRIRFCRMAGMEGSGDE